MRERKFADRKAADGDRRSTLGPAATIAQLAAPKRCDDLGRHELRFIFALRCIALHQKAGQDPLAFLAVKLGSVTVAGKAIELAETASRFWPEKVHVARPCCRGLSHDEVTLAALVRHAAGRDRAAFDAQVEGLVRSERIGALWECALALVRAECA